MSTSHLCQSLVSLQNASRVWQGFVTEHPYTCCQGLKGRASILKLSFHSVVSTSHESYTHTPAHMPTHAHLALYIFSHARTHKCTLTLFSAPSTPPVSTPAPRTPPCPSRTRSVSQKYLRSENYIYCPLAEFTSVFCSLSVDAVPLK